MKPRIFISSTFYDLKYIREDLANFVRSYGYEPVLFEDGDIGYTPGKTLDSSCYESMRNSDMVILIIGGEYGSAASGEKKDEFNEYMSVTRNEFRTAVETGIPVFTMIDKKVMAEFGVYDANYEAIERENIEMAFPTTKNINVFRFIKEIKGVVTLPVQEFERSADIKGFISKQWADMFKNYLNSLRNEKENRKIENSVNEMKSLIQKMDIMLDSIGKSVLLKEDPKEYERVINQQEILAFCDAMEESFQLVLSNEYAFYDEDEHKKVLSIVLNYFKEGYLMNNINCEDLEKLLNKNGYQIIHIKLDLNDYFRSSFYLLQNSQIFEKIIEVLSRDKYAGMIL